MPIVVVANPKGGVGKSTVATQVAAYFAQSGHKVMLGDVDRQQSSKLWLGLRPAAAHSVFSWEASGEGVLVKPPRGTTHVVLDTPAGLHGQKLKDVLRLAHKVLIPLQPSVFDMHATRDFLLDLSERKRTGKLQLGVVGMRVDARTKSAEQLRAFVDSLDVPVLTYLRNTQNYVQLAAQGLTVFDVAPARVAKDLEQWTPLCDWLDN